MRCKLLLLSLCGLLWVQAGRAAEQGFGSGPDKAPPANEVRMQGGGYNPYTGRHLQFETTHNPATGRIERRSISRGNFDNRVRELRQSYDPATGTVASETIEVDMVTGRNIRARRSLNLLTGERSHAVGLTNPQSGEMQGVFRQQNVDPASGTRRADVGRFDTNRATPNLGTGAGARYFYSPYHGGYQQATGRP